MSHDPRQADLRGPSELMRLLEIDFQEIGPSRVSGSVAADERHHQPWGLVHGGLYTAVIEPFATTGAYEAVKNQGQPGPPPEHRCLTETADRGGLVTPVCKVPFAPRRSVVGADGPG